MNKIFCQEWMKLYKHWQDNNSVAFERTLTDLQHSIRSGKFEEIDASIKGIILSLETRNASLATNLDRLNQHIAGRCREHIVRGDDGRSGTPSGSGLGNPYTGSRTPKDDQYL